MQLRRLLARASLAACALSAAVAASAQESAARLEITATAATLVNFEIVGTSQGGLANWSGDGWKKVVAHFPASADWREGFVTFKPQESGRVSLDLGGRWARLDEETRLLKVIQVDYDDVRVTGATLRNGGFEEIHSTGEPRHWYAMNVPSSNPPISEENRARLLDSGAPEGAHFVRVWHNSRLGQILDVVAGTPVTITFRYRLAK